MFSRTPQSGVLRVRVQGGELARVGSQRPRVRGHDRQRRACPRFPAPCRYLRNRGGAGQHRARGGGRALGSTVRCRRDGGVRQRG